MCRVSAASSRCVLVRAEVHRVPRPDRQRRAYGSPRPAAAMMSRCTSFVPPPKVRIRAARCIRSMRPARTAPARVLADVRVRAQHLHQQPVGLGRELGAEDLGGRGPGGPGPWPPSPPAALSASAAIRQLISLRNSALACTRARLSWTHSWSMTRRPVASLVARGPVADLAQRGADRRRRGERDPLVVELVGDQRPALVLVADQGGGGHAHVGVVGGAGGRARPWCAPGSRRTRARRSARSGSTGPCAWAPRGRSGRPATRSRRTGSGWSTSSGR